MRYTMRLHNEPFQLIKMGTKKIELRLNDEKRQKIKVNDEIEFINRKNQEVLVTKVIALHHYQTFTELYKHFTKEELGYMKDEEKNPQDMEKYYTLAEQEKYGVLGIEIVKE